MLTTYQAVLTGLLSLSALTQASPAYPNPAQLTFNSPPLTEPFTQPTHLANQLVRLTFDTRASAQAALDSLTESGADIWRSSAGQIDLRLDTTQLSTITAALGLDSSSVQILMDDIAAHIASDELAASTTMSINSAAALARLASASSRAPLLSPSDDPIHSTYHDYDSVQSLLEQFVTSYPDLAKLESLGQSHEGRELWALRISNHSIPLGKASAAEAEDALDSELSAFKRKGKKKPKKVGMTVIAGQHPREWIATSTALYLAHSLLLSAATPAGAALLAQLEFVFVPVVNPDGYHTTFTSDRLWRKNREPVGPPALGCVGLDLNRNWGHKFSPGNRPQPCSDSFPGSEAFQARELRALSRFLLDKDNHVKSFLDLHAYGQMLLFPYSYSCDSVTPDDENLFEGSIGASKALRAVHGRAFEVGSVCEVSLTSPGESLDWTYARAGIRWSFAAELRDTGVFGFLIPAAQIRAAGEEMVAAVDSLARFVLHKEAGGR